MKLTEHEKKTLRKLHREYSVIKEQEGYLKTGKQLTTDAGDKLMKYGGATIDVFTSWWDKVEGIVKPIAVDAVERMYAEADAINQEKAQKVAKQLRDTMKGAGTDEGKFWEITRKYSRGGEQGTKNRVLIRGAFKRAYDKDLEYWIKGDFNCKDIVGFNSRAYKLLKNSVMGGNDKAACQIARAKALRAWGYES